jgi:hypothetical protein
MNEENKKPETKIDAGELSLNELDNVAGGGILASGAKSAASSGVVVGASGNTNPPAVVPQDPMFPKGQDVPPQWLP